MWTWSTLFEHGGVLFFPGRWPKEDTVLERCFKNPFTIRRLRGGPAGPFLDGFVEALLAQGYTPETSRSYLCAADHLSKWAALATAVQRTEAYVRDQLGDARSFSLDSPKSRAPRIQALRKQGGR